MTQNSAGIMLTKEIEHYMQQWNYIKTRQTKTKKHYIYSNLTHSFLYTDIFHTNIYLPLFLLPFQSVFLIFLYCIAANNSVIIICLCPRNIIEISISRKKCNRNMLSKIPGLGVQDILCYHPYPRPTPLSFEKDN
jgi:hypothetical protein